MPRESTIFKICLLLLLATLFACGGGGGIFGSSSELRVVNLTSEPSMAVSFVRSTGTQVEISPSLGYNKTVCNDQVAGSGTLVAIRPSDNAPLYSGEVSVPIDYTAAYVLFNPAGTVTSYQIEPAKLESGTGEIRVFEGLAAGDYNALVKAAGSEFPVPVNDVIINSGNRVTWDGHGDDVEFAPGSYVVSLQDRSNGNTVATSSQFTLAAGQRVWVGVIDKGNGPEAVLIPTQC